MVKQWIQQCAQGITREQALRVFPVALIVGMLLWAGAQGALWAVLGWCVVLFVCVSAALGVWFLYTRPQRLRRQLSLEGVYTFMQAQMSRVKQMRVQARSPLVRIPHFLLVGQSGSGKTSVLRHSGIAFSGLGLQGNVGAKLPHLSEQEVQGACDWWFANEAVVIDTAGWYLEQEQAAPAWQILVRKIRHITKARGVQGVILTLRADVLFDEPALATQLELIRCRMDTLSRCMGQRIPIHWVITHLDDLPGFHAFFSGWREEERQQVLGVSVPCSSDWTAHVLHQMGAMHQRVTACWLNQLHVQSNAEDKIALAQFPQRFLAFQNAFCRALERLCQENIYQESVRVAGCYFTSVSSSTQQPGEEQGFFLHNVMRQRVFGSAQPVVLNHIKQQRRRWLSRMQKIGGAIAALGVVGILSYAYFSNARLIQQGREVVEGLSQVKDMSASFTSGIVRANQMGAYIEAVRAYRVEHPVLYWLGKTGIDHQFQQAEMGLMAFLGQDFYQSMTRHLKAVLEEEHQHWNNIDDRYVVQHRGNYYAAFRLYMMLHFPRYLDLDFASRELAYHWQKQMPGVSVTLEKLGRIYLELFLYQEKNATHTVADSDHDLIDKVRQDLWAGVGNGVVNGYAMTIAQLNRQLGGVTYEQFAGYTPADLLSSSAELPRAFTRDVYEQHLREVFQELAKANWELDWAIYWPLTDLLKPAEANDYPRGKLFEQDSLQKIHTLYLKSYYRHWMDFMKSIQMQSFLSCDDAAFQLHRIMSGRDMFSPLWDGIKANFSIFDSLPEGLQYTLPDGLKQRFVEVEKWAQMVHVKGEAFERYLNQLEALRRNVERLASLPEASSALEYQASELLTHKGNGSELYKATRAANNATRTLQYANSRDTLQQLLLLPVQEIWRAMLKDTVSGLMHEWSEEVWRTYQERIAPYFPFNSQGQDLELAEFVTFFRPTQGVLATYLKRLKSFVQRDNGLFKPTQWLGVSVPLSTAFLDRLSWMERITSGMFSQQTGELSLRYALYPVPASGVKEILFAVNNQVYPYRNGPQEWVNFSWPGSEQADYETLIRVTLADSGQQRSKTFQGAWGLFRWLKSVNHFSKTPTGYHLSWAIGDKGHEKIIQARLVSKSPADTFDLLLSKAIG